MKKIKEIICPKCGRKVCAFRDKKGRLIITSGLGIGLAITGGVIGAGIGIATGGTAFAATYLLATAGLILGSGGGFIAADKLVDRIKCPKCGSRLYV